MKQLTIAILGVCLFSGCLRLRGEPGVPTTSVDLQWQFAPNPAIYGFEIYRADRPEAEFVKVSPEIIPAIDPRSGQEPKYTFVDDGVLPGETYYYAIEARDIVNKRSMRIGPVLRIGVKSAVDKPSAPAETGPQP